MWPTNNLDSIGSSFSAFLVFDVENLEAEEEKIENDSNGSWSLKYISRWIIPRLS